MRFSIVSQNVNVLRMHPTFIQTRRENNTIIAGKKYLSSYIYLKMAEIKFRENISNITYKFLSFFLS